MKKLFFTIALVAFSIFITKKLFAVVNPPLLVAPTNAAVDQMPNVLLDWDAVTGAVSYKIQLSTDTSFVNSVILTSNVTAINLSELLFGCTYYWRIKTIGFTDSSEWTAYRKFSTILTFKLVDPADNFLSAEVGQLMKWQSNVTGCSYFDIELDTAKKFNSKLYKVYKVSGTLRQANASQLYYGLKYYWRVRGRHAKDTTDWSSVRSMTVVNAVTLTLPIDNALDVALITEFVWVNITGTLKYEYQTDTTILFNSPKLVSLYSTKGGAATAHNKTDTLLFGTRYHWRVRSMHALDTSGWGTTRHFTTINKIVLTAPADKAKNVATNPMLTWTRKDGVTAYKIEVDTINTFTHPVKYSVTATSAAGQLQVLGLKIGKTYYWRLRAINSRDTSDWSNVWSFTTTLVGIDNAILNASNIKVYPNPASDKVFVQIESNNTTQINISIINILGKTIQEDVYNVIVGSNTKELNLEGLSSGIYLLKFTKDNNSYVYKLYH